MSLIWTVCETYKGQVYLNKCFVAKHDHIDGKRSGTEPSWQLTFTVRFRFDIGNSIYIFPRIVHEHYQSLPYNYLKLSRNEPQNVLSWVRIDAHFTSTGLGPTVRATAIAPFNCENSLMKVTRCSILVIEIPTLRPACPRGIAKVTVDMTSALFQ